MSAEDEVASAGPETTGGDLREILGMAPRAAPPRLAVGQLIDGVYRIEEVLGEGGMGRVYRATDTRLARDVAVKLERHAAPDDRTLQREATALARLTHPNVVIVFEVGTWSGYPWVAMEYVRGANARAWLAATPRTPREILATYLAAARGLAASHAAGLAHRDFKPDNVLVGDDGRVRVADFGLAGDLDVELPAGEVRGTPAYMAPEHRAGGVIGPAADQFAFAVSLWEALAGRRPFEADRHDVVVPLPDRVPRHVDAALRRALAIAPVERWPSMAALIAELERDPARTWRRVGIAGAAALVVAGATWGVARTEHRAAAVSCSLGEGELAAVWSPFVRATIPDARTIAMVDRWADRWQTARRAACEATQIDHRQSTLLLDLRIACLDRARTSLVATVDELTAGRLGKRAIEVVTALPPPEECADVSLLTGSPPPPTDPAVRARLAEADGLVARARALRGAGAKEAIAAARTAKDFADRHGFLAAGARARTELAAAIYESGTSDGVLAMYEEAARLAAEAKDDVLHAQSWLNVVGFIAVREAKPGDTDRVIIAAETAIARAGRPAKLVGMLAGKRADIAFERQQFAAAVPLFQQAIAAIDDAYGSQGPVLARLHNRLASTLLRLRRYDEALVHVARSREVLETMYGPTHPHVAVVLTTHSEIAFAAGDYVAAVELARRSLAMKIATQGPAHTNLVPTLVNLAIHLESSRDLAGALPHARRAVVIAERTLPANHPRLALALSTLGRIAGKAGAWDESEATLDRAAAMLRASERPPMHDVLRALAAVRLHRKDVPGAIAAAARSVALSEKTYGASDHTVRSLDALVTARRAAGDLAGARADLDRAIAMARETLGTRHPETLALERRQDETLP